MKNIQSLLLKLLIFLFIGGVNAILGMLFSKIKFPSVIYRIGGWSLVVGFLGLLGVVFYSIFVEKIDEKVLYLFMGMTTVGMIITFPNFQGRKN